jgi:hypothetical protein
MRKSHTGIMQDPDTKNKISESMVGRTKSKKHRDAIAASRCDLDRKCMQRFLELRSEYPGHEEFFDLNQNKLLVAMRDIKSERELFAIRKYIETVRLEEAPAISLSYQYDSSSIYAQEDLMIALIDVRSFIRKSLEAPVSLTLH